MPVARGSPSWEREELAARKIPGGTEVIAETPLPPMPSAPTTPSAPPAPRPIFDPPYPIECTSLAQSTKASTSLPVSGMPAGANNNSKRSNANNKPSRKQQTPSKLNADFEYACSSTSMLGRVHAELKVPHVRLSI